MPPHPDATLCHCTPRIPSFTKLAPPFPVPVRKKKRKEEDTKHDSKKVGGNKNPGAGRIDPVRIPSSSRKARDAMVIAATRALLACALTACALLHPADVYYSLSGRMHYAVTRGTRTRGHMSQRPPALDNPVARKEGEVGVGVGHPARARNGRLIYGRERRNIGYPVEKKPEEEKDRSLERARRASSESTTPHY
ncbi:hypothetical protein B0H14DRAFT_3125053 [Mycena olivaceomarginata]|nr:hypothetical protein B0H14DRAFT_3125053 [Mycena olivaceomarginata]